MENRAAEALPPTSIDWLPPKLVAGALVYQ